MLNYECKSRTYRGLYTSGADPGFQVRGGALKKIVPSRWRRENFWGISCEKSQFYAKKSYFFPILGGARARCAPPLNPPLHILKYECKTKTYRGL